MNDEVFNFAEYMAKAREEQEIRERVREANLTIENVTYMQRYTIGEVLAKYWRDGHALTSEQVMLEGDASANWTRFHRLYKATMGNIDSVSMLGQIVNDEQQMLALQSAFQEDRSGTILADTAIAIDRVNWMRQQVAERMGGSTTVGAARGLDYAAVVKAQTLQLLGLA